MWMKKLMECVVEKISLLRKGKKPAVEYAENRFTITKMWDGKEEVEKEEEVKKSVFTDEQKNKLMSIEKKYNRH